MTNNSDQPYIDKVLNGDVNAFSILIEKYKDLVFSLAIKIVKNREEAEEVAQDSFIKAYKSLNRFKGDSKFSTWLYKITFNNCMDVVKKKERKYNTVKIDDVTENKIESVENTLDFIERKERAKIIESCLSLLPDEERTILWLFYFQENSLKEIVNIMSLSEANVKVKLHRARKRLLTVVKENVEPEIIDKYGN